MAQALTGIDPADLETCLRVLAEAGNIDSDHPDSILLQRASGKMFNLTGNDDEPGFYI